METDVKRVEHMFFDCSHYCIIRLMTAIPELTWTCIYQERNRYSGSLPCWRHEQRLYSAPQWRHKPLHHQVSTSRNRQLKYKSNESVEFYNRAVLAWRKHWRWVIRWIIHKSWLLKVEVAAIAYFPFSLFQRSCCSYRQNGKIQFWRDDLCGKERGAHI